MLLHLIGKSNTFKNFKVKILGNSKLKAEMENNIKVEFLEQYIIEI